MRQLKYMQSKFLYTLLFTAGSVLAQGTAPAQVKDKPAIPTAPAPAASPETATPAAAPDQTVLTVGNEKVTAAEFEALIEALPEQVRTQARGPGKRQLAEQFAQMKVLAQEARLRGLDKSPTLQTRLALQKENLLAAEVVGEIQKTAKVDDAAVQKYYEDHKGEFQEAQARHILVKFKGSPVATREGKPELTEEEALAKSQELRKRLLAGEDFAKLAKEESDDTGSGANGGDLGTFKRGSMVPAFEEAAFTLPVGEVSEPLKTQFGYHLIKVEKREAKTLEQVRPELDARIKPELTRKAVEALRNKTTVTFDENYFGSAPAPGAPAVAPTPAPPAAK
jgi:parvulin-like peptidyl-prolyl isomerase